ncbi:non-ribosomal peptide synthetase [Tellurirhabdus bombi]|uniref:non-ribosomal peptide synthetase n=1 Tax=Tellurirhabdus bombi TaxID=2907205 RepID=UPI001F2578CA|nr:non-ribosomal peptide synthetase [Tellurirhabdus bombi]
MVDTYPKLTLTEVDFDPFAGPEMVRLTPTIEPQLEIWTSCILGGDDANRAYNESVTIRLKGLLNRFALEQAFQSLIQRHEALRSAFSADGQQLCIFKDLFLPIAFQDISAKVASKKEQLIQNYVMQDALHVFDLQNGPLCKAGLSKLSEEEHHFVLTVHHIVADGWSLGLMLQDLSAFYSAYAKGIFPNLPEAEQISAYAQEQIQFAQSEEYQHIEAFWLKQYQDAVPELSLPTDFARPHLRTFKSKRLDFVLDKELAQAIKKVGVKAGCSFVTTLVAAFEVFLQRLTGQEDIIVGLPTAGQSATGNYRLVGHCVNLLPLRSKAQKNLRFLDFLKQRKSEIFDAYEHQQLTFGRLLKKLPLTRNASRVPMVPVVFNIDMGLGDGVAFYGLEHALISNPREYENFDLFLNINGAEQAPVLEWSYNTQLFKASTISRMMDSFEAVLRAIVTDPLVILEAIEFTDQVELFEKLDEWNKTQASYPKNTPVHQLIAQTAARYPDKTALVFKDKSMSYQELNTRANQLAHYLLAEGVEVGDVIGLVLDRSPELLIALLAILKAGAAYVPLDPDYPQDRIAFMMEDSGAKMLLTSKKYQGRLESRATEVLVENILSETKEDTPKNPNRVVAGHDLAYILYTSGSTGKPKGVLIEHRNLVNLLHSMISMPGISKEDRLLAVTTVSFDIAGLELYLPLLVGATVVLADAETAKDGRALVQAIDEQQISIMQATPVTWKMMLAAGWEQKLPVKVLCCGEPMSKDLAEKLTARCESLWNMYGPTETTIYSTGKQILREDEIITIGRPIHNTQVYILDEQEKPLLEGVVGEIYIAGDGVARGYLNRPELNEQKFVKNPFGTGLMYRTGDLGKFTATGEIHCLGRIDQQIKVRGYRIEPGEIEHLLVTKGNAKEAVVLAREDRPGDQRLVAYVVSKKALAEVEFKAEAATWKAQLREALPSYMVPSDFVNLAKLPVTPNGKVDRNALPKPTSGNQSNSLEKAVPLTEMEKLVKAIWVEELGKDGIDIQDDFFELGGHSMIAVQVMARLEKATKKRLPLSTLFEYSTIQKLASLLSVEEQKTQYKSLVPIKPSGSKTPIYLVHGNGLNVLTFYGLANQMEADQPVYGLQAKGLDGTDEPLETIEAIAAFYNSEIIRQNPAGPYALAGYSFGGYVAMEMAQQLKKMGKEVKMLAMFDTNANEVNTQSSPIGKLNKKIVRQFYKMLWISKSFSEDPSSTIKYQQDYFERQFKNLLESAGIKAEAKPEGESIFSFMDSLIEKYNAALRNYKMVPYDGVIDLFRAQERPYFVDDFEYLGWKEYALQGVRIHEVPGDHSVMLQPPNDKEFARILQDALDNS